MRMDKFPKNMRVEKYFETIAIIKELVFSVDNII